MQRSEKRGLASYPAGHKVGEKPPSSTKRDHLQRPRVGGMHNRKQETNIIRGFLEKRGRDCSRSRRDSNRAGELKRVDRSPIDNRVLSISARN